MLRHFLSAPLPPPHRFGLCRSQRHSDVGTSGLRPTRSFHDCVGGWARHKRANWQNGWVQM